NRHTARGVGCGDHRGGGGNQGEQATQTCAGLIHRPVLQGLGDGIEKGQCSCLLNETENHRTGGTDGHEQADTQPTPGHQVSHRAGNKLGGSQEQRHPEQDGCEGSCPGDEPVQNQTKQQGHTGCHRDQDGPVTPPGGVFLRVHHCVCGFTSTCRGHCSGSPSGAQQPTTGHCGSMQSAF